MEPPAAITTAHDHDRVSATASVAAAPSEVFEFLRRPANHARLSGDRSVREAATGDEVLGPGSRFGMKMKIGVPYRVTSRVVEFEPDRVLAWSHFAGHRWRWELTPTEGGTRVTETFDMATARFPPALRLLGYPKRHLDNVTGSVANLVAHFAPTGD